MPEVNETASGQSGESLLEELERLAGQLSTQSTEDIRRTRAREERFADRSPDTAIDRIARLAAAALRVPVAAITLRTDARSILKAVHGQFCIPDGGLAVERRVVEAGESVVLPDLAATPEFAHMGGARFYAGAPALNGGRRILGVLSVIDFEPRPLWGGEETTLLEDAAEHLASELRLRADVLHTSSALRESELRFRQLYNTIPVGVYRRNPEGCILMANRAMALMLGFASVAELLEHPRYQFREEDDEAFMKRLGDAGGIRGEEARWRRRDGSVFYVRQTSCPVYGADGKVLYWEGVAEDVTETRRAGDALRATEIRFQAFMDHTPAVAYIKDRAGRRIYLNETHRRIYGPRADECLYKTVEEMFSPEDAARLRAVDETVFRTDTPIQTIERLPVPGDGVRDWLTLKFPFASETGEPLLGGVSLDITNQLLTAQALRENQERLLLAQSAAGIVAFEWDVPTGRISRAETAVRVLGAESPVLSSLDQWRCMIHPEDRPGFDAAVHRMLDGGEARSYEYRMLLPDGQIEWVSSIGRVVSRDSGGQPLKAVGISQNISERRRAQDALRESEERFRMVAENCSDFILDCNLLSGEVVLYGSEPDTPAPRTFDELYQLVHPEDRPRITETYETAIRDGGRIETEFRVRRPDGSYMHLYHRAVVLLDASGRPCRLIGSSVNVTARKHAEEEIARLAALVQSSADAIIGLSLEGEILTWNHGAERMLGYPEDMARGRPWTILAAPGGQRVFERITRRVSRGGSLSGSETRMLRNDGAEVEVSLAVSPIRRRASGELIGISAIARDITDRKRAEEQLTYQARHDLLTGLPNRRRLTEHLERTIARARSRSQLLALLYVDLDGFKLINDTFGHAVGDTLLQEVAARFEAEIQDNDMLARMGGDEFMLLAERTDTPEAGYNIARRLLEALEEPFHIAGTRLYVSASIGISLYPIHAADATTLQRTADAAMYEAKRAGKNRIRFYMPQIGIALRERLELGNELRSALERKEMSLDYQPLFALNNGRRLTGMEALLRWTHPRFGPVPPTKFIPIAEETGMILPIGEWVIEQVCRDLRRWTDEDRQRVRVALNVSAIQFMAPNFASQVQRILARTGVSPEQIELELTESSVFANFEDAVAKMQELRAMGVKFALDDFGTGFSSLSYLQRLPLSALKIDRSFVAEIGRNSGSLRLIQAIVSLAHGLGLRVVIEGLETRVQMEAAGKVGCDEGQGFLLGRPGAGDAWVKLAT